MSTATSARGTTRIRRAPSRSLGMLVVRVVAHEDEGSWWAETPDYPGLTVVAPTREELTERIKPAVQFHLEESGTDVDLDELTIYTLYEQPGPAT